MRLLLSLCLLCLPGESHGSEFKIAAIYPLPSESESVSVGAEAVCITKAVFHDAVASGLNVKLDFFDNKRSPAGTAQAAKSIVKSGYDLTIGTFSSSRAVIAARILNRSNIPFIALTATSPEIMLNNPLTASMASSDAFYMERLADYVKKRMGAKRIAAVVNLSKLESVSSYEAFSKAINKTNIKMKRYDIVSGFDRYNELVRDFEKEQIDTIFLSLDSFEAGSFYKHCKQAKAKVSIIGAGTIGGRADFYKLIGDLSPYIDFKFTRIWNDATIGPYSQHFDSLMKTKCSRFQTSMVSTFAYDVSKLIVEELALQPQLRSIDFFHALLRRRFPRLSGLREFGQDRFTKEELHIFEVGKGKSIYRETY